ncbi:type II toxin-antitoxin system prevent-host-death family antitoxin [Microbacterium sp. X-17]|uniref:type II toxin-antitoxin system Phd/YefM family antitoxin n=1 Tax=Microbacterium sp. X-17 TaxID=3144404 RepID=UPI0031F5D161
MSTLSQREMRNNSSQVLRAVAAGESYVITNDGLPVARLVPIDGEPTVPRPTRAATKRGGLRDLPRHLIQGTLAETLDELRGEK